MNKSEIERILKRVCADYELDFSADDQYFDIYVTNYNADSYGINHVDTQVFNKRGYERFERVMDNLQVRCSSYNFDVLYDVSGYEYWTKDMQESNYICISILIHNYDADFSKFEEDLDKFISNVQEKYREILSHDSYIRKGYESCI